MDNSDSATSMAAITEMFMSHDFGFYAFTSNALARLYDYVAHGTELPVADIERWYARGILDLTDRYVHMPGPVDDAPSWILLGLVWNGLVVVASPQP